MAKIILSLKDEDQARSLAELLAEKRHAVAFFKPVAAADDAKAAAEALLKEGGAVAVMHYCSEDAASVKLMQSAEDSGSPDVPAFIFIDPPGSKIDREQALMALNEGAYAFLPADFKPASLINYVERALQGPGRLRRRAQNPESSDENLKKLEEALGKARTMSASFKKLIAHLMSSAPGSQNRRLLLVSNSPYQLEMLKKMLEEHGFQVFTARNPADGLTLALSEKPGIIVSELELDGRTGIEFCQDVKFTHKLTPCYFVICTSNPAKIAKVMVPGNGVDDCLLKPSGPGDAAEFVSRAALGLLL